MTFDEVYEKVWQSFKDCLAERVQRSKDQGCPTVSEAYQKILDVVNERDYYEAENDCWATDTFASAFREACVPPRFYGPCLLKAFPNWEEAKEIAAGLEEADLP